MSHQENPSESAELTGPVNNLISIGEQDDQHDALPVTYTVSEQQLLLQIDSTIFIQVPLAFGDRLPTNGTVLELYNFARENFNLGHYDRAEVLARELFQIDPHSVDVILLSAATQFMLRNFDRSLEFCQMALAEDPQSSMAYTNIGIIRKETGLLVEAVQNFKKAVEVELNFDAYYLLISTLISLGEKEQAIQVCDEVLKHNPVDSIEYE